MKEKIPVVLLAGGLGTRMREETEYKPKPMVEIGNYPVLWHIMKNFAAQGHNEFVICAGYKSEKIKEFFLNYQVINSDFTINLGAQSIPTIYENNNDKWSVTVANTGSSTMTGGRVKKIAKYVNKGRFIVTYGDGLADINLSELVNFHLSHGKIATVTTVQPISRFGVMDIDSKGRVSKFREKPILDDWINAGYFVFEPEVLDILEEDSVLEKEPLSNLAESGELYAYKHRGFWQPMDTYRESKMLNDLWEKQEAPWKIW